MKSRYRIETHSVLLFVLAHFCLAFLLILLTQGIFAWVNHSLFSPMTFGETLRVILGNLHFAASGAAMSLLPFVLLMTYYLRRKHIHLCNILARIAAAIGIVFLLATNVADIPYYQWTLRRTAGDIFSYLSQNFEGGLLIGQLLKDFWYYFILFNLLLALWVIAAYRIELVNSESHKPKLWKELCRIPLLLFLVTTAIRGGWITQHKPLAPVDASRYAIQGNQALVINTPFSILRTLDNATSLRKVSYFKDEEELQQTFSPFHSAPADSTYSQCNVLLLILESFSEEYMGCINQGGTSYTPFLDSLAQHCAIYQGRANGKRSIESLPALFLGIPSLMDQAYITSPYSQNRIVSLPQILRRHGYENAFFHGAYNGSMNFDGFARMIGIDHYYGMDQHPNQEDFDGTWGIFDEPFLQFSATEMSQLHQPFFSTVYTISSHHPYTIPEQYKGQFPQGEIPLLETIGYVDHALRQFFATASQQPWFKNTLFVITADHAAQPLTDYYREHAYNVPFFIYFPSQQFEGRTDLLFQHIDFAPTLLGFLGFSDTIFSYGHNLLSEPYSYHITYPGNYYQLEYQGSTLTFDGNRFSPNEASEKNKRFLKALIQQYNNRMIENRFTIGK